MCKMWRHYHGHIRCYASTVESAQAETVESNYKQKNKGLFPCNVHRVARNRADIDMDEAVMTKEKDQLSTRIDLFALERCGGVAIGVV